MDELTPPSDPLSIPSQESIQPDRLRTDIALCLQAAGTRTARASLAREAFRLVAETIVEHFEARGYEVTGPTPAEKHGWPLPGFNPHSKE